MSDPRRAFGPALAKGVAAAGSVLAQGATGVGFLKINSKRSDMIRGVTLLAALVVVTGISDDRVGAARSCYELPPIEREFRDSAVSRADLER